MYRFASLCLFLLSMKIGPAHSDLMTKIQTTTTTFVLEKIDTPFVIPKVTATESAHASANPDSGTPTMNGEKKVMLQRMPTLEEFCKMLNYKKENCTCQNFPSIDQTTGEVEYPFCEKKNGTANDNKTTYTLRYIPNFSRPFAAVSTVACAIGFIGNGVIIMVAYYKRSSLSSYRLLIAELALCDFVFSITFFVSSVRSFWTNKWIYGNAMCKILQSGQVLAFLYSIGFILLIAVERYRGTLYGIQRMPKTTKLIIYVSSAINLIVGFITVIPLLVVYEVSSLGTCQESWSNTASMKYDIFLTVFYFVIPVIIVFTLYVGITRFLWRNTKENMALTEKQVSQRMEGNKRLVYIVLAILIAFIICVLPNRVVLIYFAMKNYNTNEIGQTNYMILSLVAMIPYQFHLAVNPFIYTVLDRNWRRDILMVLTCTKNRAATIRRGCQSPTTKSTSVTTARSISNSTVFSLKTTNNNNERERNRSCSIEPNLLPSSPKSPGTNDEVFEDF